MPETQEQEAEVKLTDEQLIARHEELSKKSDKSPDELTELEELQKGMPERVNKRIAKIHSEKLAVQHERDLLKQQLEEERNRKPQPDEEPSFSSPKIVDETIQIGKERYYTDDALQSMIDAKELTSQQAAEHVKKRFKAEVKNEWEQEQSQRSQQQRLKESFDEDLQFILSEHPEFDPKHSDYDPSNKLSVLGRELFEDSDKSKPHALKRAYERAKQILRIDEKRPDVSNLHSVGKSRGFNESVSVSNKTELTDDEKSWAIRMYCFNGTINPRTNRPYTEAEAISKYASANKNRSTNGRR